MFLDDPSISGVVFYPRKTKVPDKLGHNIETLKFQINDNIQIGGMCYYKDKDLPTILMFHGNGEVALDYLHFYKTYHECNANLAVADFRGYGFSTGTPVYSGLLDDSMPIYNQFKVWMENNGFNNSLFVQGRSLGSVCAAEIGGNNPPDLKGVIFESGFASIYNMMTGLFGVRHPSITPETLAEYSNDTRIKKFQKPTLVIHGTGDWIVPYTEGQSIFENIPDNVEKQMVSIKGAGHNDIFMFEQEYFGPVKEFIEKYK